MGGTDIIIINPTFVDASDGDFHLQRLSYVIDRCASDRVRDIDNQPRPAVLYRPATPYDVGADEVMLEVYLPLAFKSF